MPSLPETRASYQQDEQHGCSRHAQNQAHARIPRVGAACILRIKGLAGRCDEDNDSRWAWLGRKRKRDQQCWVGASRQVKNGSASWRRQVAEADLARWIGQRVAAAPTSSIIT